MTEKLKTLLDGGGREMNKLVLFSVLCILMFVLAVLLEGNYYYNFMLALVYFLGGLTGKYFLIEEAGK